MSFPSAVSTPLAPEPIQPPRRAVHPRPRRGRARTSLLAHGEPLVWLIGGALAVALFMIVGMIALIAFAGGTTFWPQFVYEIQTRDGRRFLGELTQAETYRLSADEIAAFASRPKAHAFVVRNNGLARRIRLRTGDSFVWINDLDVAKARLLKWATVVERLGGGRLYGQLASATAAGKLVADKPDKAWAWHQAQAGSGDQKDARVNLVSADRRPIAVPVDDVVRLYPANQLGVAGRLGVYLSRWREFLLAGPRAANTEGGVFPAIVGTVAMTVFMSLAVVPFGVLAALYMREYARPGLSVSLVRIAVNNLAGVPSIVYGVFGLGFFCYVVGASVDQLFFAEHLPSQPTFGKGGLLWASLTLALLTLPVVIVATEEALAAVPRSMREGSFACGASKWQTIRRIVLPRSMPGIMTGLILAMARGAGEVAPLMLVGVTNLAFELPIDAAFPFVHLERKFMHLGFHIYSLGYQSPNSEAARPLVFTTTLLLIVLIAGLNLIAVALRSRLRRRYALSQF